MARVYLAEDLKHGRRVAIKVMNSDISEADRFLREIEIAARLTHPHILPLHDSGVIEDQPYYVMPYIEGESLRQRMIRLKAFSIDDTLRFAKEIASALGYAHQQVAMSLAGLNRSKTLAPIAIQLAGAVKAEWDRLGADIHVGFWDELLDRYLGAAQQALSSEDFEHEWQKGRAMSFDDAVNLALAI